MIDWKPRLMHGLWGMLSGVRGKKFQRYVVAFRYCILGFHMHDRTKIQTRKFSIFLSFYFFEVLQQLNTFTYKNVRFERVLDFPKEDTWISKLLRDAARPRKLSCMWAKNVYHFFLRFCYLNISCLRINITFIFINSSSDVFTIL